MCCNTQLCVMASNLFYLDYNRGGYSVTELPHKHPMWTVSIEKEIPYGQFASKFQKKNKVFVV